MIELHSSLPCTRTSYIVLYNVVKYINAIQWVIQLSWVLSLWVLFEEISYSNEKKEKSVLVTEVVEKNEFKSSSLAAFN